jgi:heat-inducible transcriptional repressor
MLNERKKTILSNIVWNYVHTYTPVSSQVVAREVPLSTASIRNEMAHLQSVGLIYVPHTSSGRVPTTEGYQLYVQEIMPQDYMLDALEKKIINQAIENVLQDFTQVKTFLAVLAKLTNLISFGVKPFSVCPKVLKVDFVKLSNDKICLNLTLDTDVKSRIIKTQNEISDTKLTETAQWFNERFAGLEITAIQKYINELGTHIEQEYRYILQFLLKNELKAIEQEVEDLEVIYEGLDEVLHQPEFKQVQYLHELIQTIESENHIKQVLSHTESPVSITVGINPNTEEKFSMVQASYYLKEDVKGYIGFIGPQRMHYPKLYAIANYTIKQLNFAN